MKYSKFFWFLIAVSFIDLYVVISSYQKVHGGICDGALGIDGISCLSVSYLYNLIHLIVVVSILFYTKNKSIQLIHKILLGGILILTINLVIAYISFDLLKLFWMPIAFVLLVIMVFRIVIKRKK